MASKFGLERRGKEHGKNNQGYYTLWGNRLGSCGGFPWPGLNFDPSRQIQEYPTSRVLIVVLVVVLRIASIIIVYE